MWYNARNTHTSVRYMPCQVPKLSLPFVIGIDIVEPITDVFVWDTLIGSRRGRSLIHSPRASSGTHESLVVAMSKSKSVIEL
jgi:hypothetical protein